MDCLYVTYRKQNDKLPNIENIKSLVMLRIKIDGDAYGKLTLDDHHVSVDRALEDHLSSGQALGEEFLAGSSGSGSSSSSGTPTPGTRTVRGRRLASAVVATGTFTSFGGFSFACHKMDPPATAGATYVYVARREYTCGSYEAELAAAAGLPAASKEPGAPECASWVEGVPYKPGVETGVVPQDGRHRKVFVEERVFRYMDTEVSISTYPNHPLQLVIDVRNDTHHKRYQLLNDRRSTRGYHCLIKRRERSTFEVATALGADLSDNFRVTYF